MLYNTQSPEDIKDAMIILRDKLDSFIKTDTFTKTMVVTSLEVDDQKMNIDNDDDVDNKPTEPTYNTTVVASGHCPSTITGSVCVDHLYCKCYDGYEIIY